ncbi:MAG: TetR/AcrR family transcriptional regulator [Desulforhopalus sp.]
MSKRDEILKAAKNLFWRQGYDATSPKQIQSESSAGQGSFYHHFPSKKALAIEVIRQTVTERLEAAQNAFSGTNDFFTRFDRFLDIASNPLYGCKVGRWLWDASIVEDIDLRGPLAFYFTSVGELLMKELTQAETRGEIWLQVPKHQLALMIMAVVQGGFVLSRANQSPDKSADALKGLRQTLMFALSPS